MPSNGGPADEAFEAGLSRHFRRGMGAEDTPVAARWTRTSELSGERWQWKPGAWFLGYRAGMVIGREDDRHCLLVAGSRAGKGVSVILPNVLLWPGSVLAIDPKGELAAKTAGMRKRCGHKIVLLDPFNASKLDPKKVDAFSFNPLAEIDPAAPDAPDRAAMIADGLILDEGDTNRHWTDSAKQLLKAIILYTLMLPEAERDLVTVRALLMLRSGHIMPVDKGAPISHGLYALLRDCKGEGGMYDVIHGIGVGFFAKPEKEAGSILSTAQTQTDFLDSTELADVLCGSKFRLRELKGPRPVAMYLCLPATFMGTHARWLRIVINLALAAFERTEAPEEAAPVLLVLEEFNILGHMASIANAAGQIAGFGVRMLTVLQDLTQLQRHYKESWETFIGNAAFVLAFANSDATTLDYLSKKLGTISVAVETSNPPTLAASHGGASGLSYNVQSMPLMPPHEVEQAFARDWDRLLALYAGGKPITLRRSISHHDPRFRPMLDLPL